MNHWQDREIRTGWAVLSLLAKARPVGVQADPPGTAGRPSLQQQGGAPATPCIHSLRCAVLQPLPIWPGPAAQPLPSEGTSPGPAEREASVLGTALCCGGRAEWTQGRSSWSHPLKARSSCHLHYASPSFKGATGVAPATPSNDVDGHPLTTQPETIHLPVTSRVWYKWPQATSGF